MLKRYVVIAVYGLKNIFNKEPIFLLFDLDTNTVVGYFFSEEDALGVIEKLNAQEKSKEINKNKSEEKKTINSHETISVTATINEGNITISGPGINTTQAESLADYLISITQENDDGGKNKLRNKPR